MTLSSLVRQLREARESAYRRGFSGPLTTLESVAIRAIPALASAVERLEKLAEDCEAKARDDTRRQGKRIVYGAIAADLRDILDGQP